MTNSTANLTADSIKHIYMDSDKVNYFVKDSSSDTTLVTCASEEDAVKAVNDIFRNILSGANPSTTEVEYLYAIAVEDSANTWQMKFTETKPEGVSAKVQKHWSEGDRIEVARCLLKIPTLAEVKVVNEQSK